MSSQACDNWPNRVKRRDPHRLDELRFKRRISPLQPDELRFKRRISPLQPDELRFKRRISPLEQMTRTERRIKKEIKRLRSGCLKHRFTKKDGYV